MEQKERNLSELQFYLIFCSKIATQQPKVHQQVISLQFGPFLRKLKIKIKIELDSPKYATNIKPSMGDAKYSQAKTYKTL